MKASFSIGETGNIICYIYILTINESRQGGQCLKLELKPQAVISKSAFISFMGYLPYTWYHAEIERKKHPLLNLDQGDLIAHHEGPLRFGDRGTYPYNNNKEPQELWYISLNYRYLPQCLFFYLLSL